MTRRLTGAVASCLVLLTGLWLILAPFALGIQPDGADWRDETFTDVWSGIGLAVIGVIGVIAFAAALLQSLTDRGLIRSDDQASTDGTAAEPATVPEPALAPAAAPVSDLDKLLSPLVQALTEDLNRERNEPANAATTGEGPAGPVNRAAEMTNTSNGAQRRAPAEQQEA